jgi:hypothetical protein
MALFTRLLRLHSAPVSREDFVTAVLAGVLQAHPDLALAWLRGLPTDRVSRDRTMFSIGTQHGFGRLETHFAGSRPDLVATVIDEVG